MLHVASFEEKRVLADLPVEICIEVPPVTYCGVDMFGPYLIKERRSQLKRYGALFTCFTCRAIHMKVTNALETNSFIFARRRFMARRGAVRSIWEQGMNCSKYSRKWITIKSRTSCKKTGQIGLTGTIIHQQHHIWVAFGNVKSEQ